MNGRYVVERVARRRLFFLADANRQATKIIDDTEPVLVGHVVADKYGTSAVERRMLQQFPDGFTFVMIARSNFQDHLAVDKPKLRAQFAHHAGDKLAALRLEFRRPPIMQRKAGALFFDEQSLVFIGKCADALQDVFGKLRLYRGHVTIPQAQFCSVRTGASKPLRRKNAVNLRNRATADQGQGTIKPLGQVNEQRDERRVGAHVAWVVLDVDERAVDVEEQRRRFGAYIRGRMGHL